MLKKLVMERLSKLEQDESPSSEWNPMGAQRNSFQNLNCPEVQSAITGVLDFKGSLCPHADSSGGCYKGSRCPHRYHIDQYKIAQNPKTAFPVVSVAVTHFSKLQTQPEGIVGMIFKGTVTYMVSPFEFYVVPEKNLICRCSNEIDVAEDQLTTMIREMEEYYSRHQFRNATSVVTQELLAVRLMFRGKKSYFRAVVLDDLFLEVEGPPPNVKCFLLDIGKTVTVNLFKAASLPKIFCHKPPMVYKCSIYGITSSPTTNDSKKIRRRFGELINWQNAILIVRRLSNPTQSQRLPWLTRPIEVEMRVRLDANKPFVYTNVKDKLSDMLKFDNIPLPWRAFTDAQIDLLARRNNNNSVNVVSMNNLLHDHPTVSRCSLCLCEKS